MTVCPARFIVRAPAGIATAPVRPTAVILAFAITTVWFSAGGAPVPSTTRTPVRATTGASTLTKVRVNCPRESAGCAARGARGETRAINATGQRMRSLDWVRKGQLERNNARGAGLVRGCAVHFRYGQRGVQGADLGSGGVRAGVARRGGVNPSDGATRNGGRRRRQPDSALSQG